MKDQQKQPQFEINKKISYSPCFEQNASFLSRAFFLWCHQLIKVGSKKHLELSDLSDLKDVEEPIYSYNKFSSIYSSFSSSTPKKIMASFKKYLDPMFVLAGILATIANLLQFSGPLMISKVLQFLGNRDESIGTGIFYVSVLVLCYLLRTIVLQHSMHFLNLSCIRVLNSGTSVIYTKILNLSSASRKYLQTGSIMNHINVDIMSFYFFIMMSTFLFSAPFMILTAIVMLVIQVGWIGLAAPIIFAVGMFFQQKIMKKGFQLRKDQLFWTDKRTKCVNEYFSGIRIIKYYGWEKLVADKIQSIRKQELSLIFKNLMLRTYVEVLMNMLPIFASIVIFAVYSAQYGSDKLTPAKVFTVLSVFNLIATPMRLVVMTLITFMNAQASLARIQHFFGYQEKNQEGINTNDQDLQKGQIIFDDCRFNWQNQKTKKHFEEGKKLNIKKPDQKAKEAKQAKEAKEKKKQSAVSNVQKKKIKKKVKKPANQSSGDSIVKKKKKKKKKPVQERESLLSDQKSLKASLLDSEQSSQYLSSDGTKFEVVLTVPKLRIRAGTFLGIIGRVGSGKSTLLYSILGQIDKITGTINRRGSIAYIPQTSWLRSATIRENIIFEGQFDEKRYKQILKLCQLQTDLQILGGGDLTEIGQKGVNLSGGQKQRISIARALYANADIYLIDDCLSALDSYVGKNIFHNVLKDYLHNKGKTVVFVTNAIDYTQYCDRVIVLQKGRIVQDGNPNQLKDSQDTLFKNLKMDYKKSVEHQEEEKKRLEQQKLKQKKKSEDAIDLQALQDPEDSQKKKEPKQKKKQLQALVKVQQRLKGSVPWIFYYRFFTGPGAFTTIMMFLFISLAQLARVFSDWWLGQWSNNRFNMDPNSYIQIYAGISVLVGLLMFIKGKFFARFIISTSRVIQRTLIQSLLKTPLSWFDVTPTGRILARATKDQDDLDNSLAFNVQFATQNLFVLISSLVLISVATPIYLIIAVISGLVYYKLVGLYMNSSRQIKRIQANTRAPLISHIQETITGTYIIRAFDKIDNFVQKYYTRQKAFIVATVNQNIATRWINLVTDLFSILTIATAGYLGVITAVANVGTSSTNLIGLSLVWSLQISGIMSFTLRVLADTQSNMNAVVRLYDYIDNNPKQAQFEQPKPAHNTWPDKGEYSIKNISYKYRPELPLVIKKISFDIQSKAKIGIVGRTGSGKSTMTLGLLRILQLADNQDLTKGIIELDDQNVSNLGLHLLRHNITIIPQDPTLFTGTIRSNIDPFSEYSDQQIAECLKRVSLWDQIKEDPEEKTAIKKKVNCKVDDGGSNFSLGQRQLVCMARALIRRPKVLLMDEATASIDQKTDETIQTMIRTQFTQTTVITIAHRLNTIIYYDKILVLDHGEVKQYDTPLNLVKNQNTFLGNLIRKTGKAYADRMINLAENKISSNK